MRYACGAWYATGAFEISSGKVSVRLFCTHVVVRGRVCSNALLGENGSRERPVRASSVDATAAGFIMLLRVVSTFSLIF